MAVTITVAELVAALRLSDSAEELQEATRLLSYASEAVVKHVPTAPDAVHDEAVRRLAGYIYDMPEAARGDSYANALRNSGAARMLLPYRVHSAGAGAAVREAQAAVGTTGNPVTDIDITGTTLTVTFADGTTETHTLPAGGMGGTLDQTARDAAADAQTDADAAQATATGNTTALAAKLERADVSAGVGIAVTPTSGSDTGFTISTTGSTGPAELSGAWTWVTVSPSLAGEVRYSATALVGEIDSWLFNVTGNNAAQGQLLDLASGDTVEIEQSASRHQTITVTSTPTQSGNTVTVSGRADRGLSSQIPTSSATVTITLAPGPVQGIDQTARDAAADAQTAADANTTARVAHAADANAHHVPPVIAPDNPSALNHPVRMGLTVGKTGITGSDLTYTSDDGVFRLPVFADFPTSNPYVSLWRSDADGGAIEGVGGTLNFQITSFSQATALVVGGVAGHISTTVTNFNGFIISEETIVVLNLDGSPLLGSSAGEDTTAREAAAANAVALTAHEADADAHHVPPTGGGGTAARWYFVGAANGPFTVGTGVTVHPTYPLAGYADYAALRAAVIDESITQILVRISQNDPGDLDDDHGTSVHANANLLRQAAGSWRVFPGHALSVDPVGFTVAFGASGLTVAADTAVPATPAVQVRVGVWK